LLPNQHRWIYRYVRRHNSNMLAIFELPTDPPGFSDPAYRARRGHIAAVGAAYHPGDTIPDVEYTAKGGRGLANRLAPIGPPAPSPRVP